MFRVFTLPTPFLVRLGGTGVVSFFPYSANVPTYSRVWWSEPQGSK